MPVVPVRAVTQMTPPAPRAATQQVDPHWLAVDTTTRTATFQLIAGLTGLNGALNFNGFKDGGLTLAIPLDWTVVIEFRNHDGMLPHSAEVIDSVAPLPAMPVDPVFPRAFTARLMEGLPPEGQDTMTFTASKLGSFLIFCGVPGHGLAGMWIRFNVRGRSTRPALLTPP